MCRVCEKVSKLPPEEGLKLVEVSIKSGKNPEHFKAVLDKVLGTEVPEQDVARDGAWENSYRRR